MKETGLMFKAPLVHAILSGQKTQTRRVMKPQPAPCTHDAWPTNWVVEGCEWHCAVCGNGNRLNPRAKSGVSGINCPMGKPGDRIYVRETWQHANFPLGPYQEGAPVFYRVDYQHESDPDYVDAERTIRRNWRPSIHMPKQAARIWLEITGVRVERLQEITEGDAEREGVQLKDGSDEPYSETNRDGFRYRNYQSKEGAFDCRSARESFRSLWQSTGGDWAANPWVWVIDFKTISTTGRPA